MLRQIAAQPDWWSSIDPVRRQYVAALIGEFGLQWQPGAKNQEWNFNTQLAGLMALTANLPVALTCR